MGDIDWNKIRQNALKRQLEHDRRYYSSGSYRRTAKDRGNPNPAGGTGGPCPCGTCARARDAAQRASLRSLERARIRNLPRVQEDMPILARRQVTLHLQHPDLGRIDRPFGAINQQFGQFGVVATAACGAGQRHPAPEITCGCGFYSVPLDQELFNRARTDLFEALVELSGTVIEHTGGFRAYHQRILELRMPRCRRCDEPTEHLAYREFTGCVIQAVHVTCNPYYLGLPGVHLATRAEAVQVLGIPLVDQP